MPNVEEWYVFAGANIDELACELGAAWVDGWQPIGGAFVLPDGRLGQTVVKYELEPEPRRIDEEGD